MMKRDLILTCLLPGLHLLKFHSKVTDEFTHFSNIVFFYSKSTGIKKGWRVFSFCNLSRMNLEIIYNLFIRGYKKIYCR